MVTLESLDKKFETFDTKLELLDKKFDERFKRTDERFEEMDKKFDKMDQRFNQLEHKLEEKIDDLAAMTARGFSEIYERLDVIEENYVTKADLVNFTRTMAAK